MRMFTAAIVVAGALIGATAQAQTSGDMTKVCGDEGRRLGLAGAQLADFLTKCWSGGQPTMTRQQCQADARRQGLSGEDLIAFMKKCTGGM